MCNIKGDNVITHEAGRCVRADLRLISMASTNTTRYYSGRRLSTANIYKL